MTHELHLSSLYLKILLILVTNDKIHLIPEM